MSEQPTFSLAVVKGVSAGRTLRSARKRISVGSAQDNDLVVVEPNMAPRHFLVLIDGSRWRIHTLTDKDSVAIDRRWAHPDNGKRGALIRAAGAEIVLFPGHLDQRTIDREIAQRRAIEDADEMATSVNLKPLALEDPEPANEPTVAVKVNNPAASDPDLVEMAQMPTITGERPPDELREAAQQMLERRRGPVAPSVLREKSTDPVPPGTARPPAPGAGRQPQKGWEDQTAAMEPVATPVKPPKTSRRTNKWESARRASTARPTPDANIPEVLAEPESQMMAVPGGSSSVMSKRPDLSLPAEAEIIPLDGGRKRTATVEPSRSNAWDDASSGGARNAWGDGADKRALVPTRSDEERRNSWGEGPRSGAKHKRTNAWGDGARPSRPPPEPAPAPMPGPQPSAGPLTPRVPTANRIDFDALSRRTDPALEILNHPDGKYATQVRLLGAKIEEFAKNLGYRAYMVSSPEPLTGKTTAACNLAFALAEDTQRRVALVEANFRYPRFAEILGVDDRTGLISVLEGRARLNEVGFKVSDRNLVILPAGGRHPAPAEVLASPRFKTLIAELVDTVDIALIDAPSVTPFADANLILPLVDAAFLVVTENQTRRSWLARAIGQIGESRVLGSMFNRVPKRTLKALKAERKDRLRLKR